MSSVAKQPTGIGGLSGSVVYESIEQRLGIQASKSGPASVTSLAAECLRACLWPLSGAGRSGVYISRVLNVAMQLTAGGALLEPVKAAGSDGHLKARDLLADVLDELESIGDVASLPGGYWLPGPLRQVDMGQNSPALLIGGVPTWLLARAGLAVKQPGLARFLTDRSSRLPTEDFAGWARVPIEPLLEWTTRIVDQGDLLPLPANEGSLEFMFYTPGQGSGGKGPFQYNRWNSNPETIRDGRYLVRYEIFKGPRHYAIGRVESGQLVATGSVASGASAVRRLLYGLDLLARLPTTVQILEGDGESVFVFRSKLPQAEERLFVATGFLEPNSSGRLYPQWWHIPLVLAPDCEAVLLRLGVNLERT